MKKRVFGTLFIDIHTHTNKSDNNLLQIVNLDLNQPCPEQGYYSYGIHPIGFEFWTKILGTS